MPSDNKICKLPDNVTVIICSVCKDKFVHHDAIIDHMLTAHSDHESVKELCKNTPKKSWYKKKDNKLVRLYHKLYFCEKCSYKTLHKTTYQRHLELHNKDGKRHNCLYCSFSTIQPYNLKLHIRNAHPFGAPKIIQMEVQPAQLLHDLLLEQCLEHLNQ